MNTYIVIGRLCHSKDIVKAVKASNAEQAKAKFEHWVRAFHGVQDTSYEFHIEHCSTYEELLDSSI